MRCFLLILFLSSSYAQTVMLVDESIDPSPIQDTFKIEKGSTYKSSLPDRTEREAFFDENKTIQKWDEAKKDIFYMDLLSKDLKQLSQKYPEISPTDLAKMKARRKP